MNHIKLLIVVVCLILITKTVSSYSLSPTKTVIFFEPGKKINVSFEIGNNFPDAYFFVVPYVENEDVRDYLLNNLILPEKTLIKKKGVETLHVGLTLPNSMEPGIYEIKLNVDYGPVKKEYQKETIVAKALAYYTIQIVVPYRGKFIKARLEDVDERNSDKYITFKINGQSLSTDEIQDAKAYVRISLNNVSKENIDSESQKILPKEMAHFVVILNTSSYEIGSYNFDTGILYDGLVAKAHGDMFIIGELNIEIENLTTNTIKKGVINRLDLNLKNLWNKNIENVYSTIQIFDGSKEVLKFRSESINLNSWSSGTLPIFIDASDLDVKTYHLVATVYFKDKSQYKDFDLIVSDKLKNPSGFSDSAKGTIVIGIILVITLINILLFIIMRRNKRGQKK